MKTCTRCKRDLEVSNFGKTGKTSAGIQRYRAICSGCKKLDDAKRFQENKELRMAQTKVHIKNRLAKMRATVGEYLLTHPCVDCGESDPVVLEFDHVRGTKVQAVSKMIASHRSKQSVLEEIAKCEVRCANCHRRVTARRGNWYNI